MQGPCAASVNKNDSPSKGGNSRLVARRFLLFSGSFKNNNPDRAKGHKMICGIIVHPQWLRVLLLSERELDAALTGAASCPGAVLLFLGGFAGADQSPTRCPRGAELSPCPHAEGGYKHCPWGPAQAPTSGATPATHGGSGIAPKPCSHWGSSLIPIPTIPAASRERGGLQSRAGAS